MCFKLFFSINKIIFNIETVHFPKDNILTGISVKLRSGIIKTDEIIYFRNLPKSSVKYRTIIRKTLIFWVRSFLTD